MSERDCGCSPGARYMDEMCSLHRRQRMRQIYAQQTPEQRAYDNYVDPAGAYHIDFPAGCTYHINPPCSFCTSQGEDEE